MRLSSGQNPRSHKRLWCGSVCWSGDRDTIKRVGDYLNHAVMTDTELTDGLRILIAGGYATDVDGAFIASAQSRDWYDAANAGKRRGVAADMRVLAIHLGGIDRDVGRAGP